MTASEIEQANARTRVAWEANAAFWDERMGEGNDFVNVLTWPPTERFLSIQPGQRVLDIACGNGLTSRRLAALGAKVVACDFSAPLIERARQRGTGQNADITYHVVDATDFDALMTLDAEAGPFDAALCAMALFDMATIEPLFRALVHRLKPGAPFVFSLIHPAFNSPYAAHVAEMEDREGQVYEQYAIRMRGYMTPLTANGAAIFGQPEPQLYFHRPLQDILAAGFAQGMVVDALEERAFPPDHPQRRPLGWGGKFSEFPAAMVVRMRTLQSGRG